MNDIKVKKIECLGHLMRKENIWFAARRKKPR